jgi:TolB-like protein
MLRNRGRIEMIVTAGRYFMKNKIAIFLLFCFCSVANAGSQRTLAVMYFENNSLTNKQDMDPLQKGLTDMLITELSKLEQFRVVERNELQRVLKEMELGQSGLVEESSVQEVGRLLGAQNLLLGSYMFMLDGQLRIDVRIVEVETGLTVKAEQETGKAKILHKLVNKLVVKIADNLEVSLTKADAKKLARTDNTSFEAAVYYAKGLEFEDSGDIDKAIQMYKKALSENSAFEKARNKIETLEHSGEKTVSP